MQQEEKVIRNRRGEEWDVTYSASLLLEGAVSDHLCNTVLNCESYVLKGMLN